MPPSPATATTVSVLATSVLTVLGPSAAATVAVSHRGDSGAVLSRSVLVIGSFKPVDDQVEHDDQLLATTVLATTVLVTTQRCLPIIRSRVNPKAS